MPTSIDNSKKYVSFLQNDGMFRGISNDFVFIIFCLFVNNSGIFVLLEAFNQITCSLSVMGTSILNVAKILFLCYPAHFLAICKTISVALFIVWADSSWHIYIFRCSAFVDGRIEFGHNSHLASSFIAATIVKKEALPCIRS